MRSLFLPFAIRVPKSETLSGLLRQSDSDVPVIHAPSSCGFQLQLRATRLLGLWFFQMDAMPSRRRRDHVGGFQFLSFLNRGGVGSRIRISSFFLFYPNRAALPDVGSETVFRMRGSPQFRL